VTARSWRFLLGAIGVALFLYIAIAGICASAMLAGLP
jgi:hypothetical protein